MLKWIRNFRQNHPYVTAVTSTGVETAHAVFNTGLGVGVKAATQYLPFGTFARVMTGALGGSVVQSVDNLLFKNTKRGVNGDSNAVQRHNASLAEINESANLKEGLVAQEIPKPDDRPHDIYNRFYNMRTGAIDTFQTFLNSTPSALLAFTLHYFIDASDISNLPLFVLAVGAQYAAGPAYHAVSNMFWNLGQEQREYAHGPSRVKEEGFTAPRLN